MFIFRIINKKTIFQPAVLHRLKSHIQNTGNLEDVCINPILNLQKHLQHDIFQDILIFRPQVEEVQNGMKLFEPHGKKKVKFLKSAVKKEQLPNETLPEIAFLGRSNVGKSSLMRCLFHGYSDLRVDISSKPGHTKCLNFYELGQSFRIIDMPGYGHNMPEHFVTSVENYIRTRRNLVRTFLLVDAKVGIISTDTIALKMLQEFGIPYVMILTKIDKCKEHLLLKNLFSVIKWQGKDHICFPQPFLISSLTGAGIPLLQTFIAYITGNVVVKERQLQTNIY
ncbi:GTP-binding protein 8-like [Argonauta hians]